MITLKQYAKLIGCDFNTLEEIQEFAENELDITLWDYPLDELEHAKEMCDNNIAIVQTDFGIRICETL